MAAATVGFRIKLLSPNPDANVDCSLIYVMFPVPFLVLGPLRNNSCHNALFLKAEKASKQLRCRCWKYTWGMDNAALNIPESGSSKIVRTSYRTYRGGE